MKALATLCLVLPGAAALGFLAYAAIHFVNVAQGVTP